MGTNIVLRRTVVVFIFILINILPSRSEIKLSDSGYQDIVINLRENLPVGNCSIILTALEEALVAGSQYLSTALDGRVHFGKFIINLPQSWPNDCVPEKKSVSVSLGEKSDITLTGTSRLFGNRIWTKQLAGCGVQGEQIFIAYQALENAAIGKEIVREWAKYRYGIFDEIGFHEDRIYPKCHFTDSQHITGCTSATIKDVEFCHNSTSQSDPQKILDSKQTRSSIMSFPQAEHIVTFCDQNTHDRYAPTKHNLLCNRRSTLEIILSHKDFESRQMINNNYNRTFSTIPTFDYRRRVLTRYVLVIDDTQDSLVRESWSFLRSAIRKWVLYDLQPNTEVGIVLTNDTLAVKMLNITTLEQQKNRDLIASFVPYTPSDSRQAACVECGIQTAIGMLAERRQQKGAASNVVLVIAPGMDLSVNYVDIADLANKNNVKLSVINYPVVLRRQPMDKLAEMTSGLAFTVLEERYNSEKSFLTTYFELSMALFHISSEYHEGLKSVLPIEVHRKILLDVANDSNSSKRISRAISGSFYLDDTMKTPSGFYIYTHNVEQPLIQNLKLISPNGINYATRSDQRMPVKQLTLIATINTTGSWTYMIERFNGNPQPHFVQVLATPVDPNASFFSTRSWFKRPKGEGPLAIYCEILSGEYPVHSAFVEVTVTKLDVPCNFTNNCVQKFRLLDTGSGDPDITKGDGIYTRYFSAIDTGPGTYKFEIYVDDNGNTAYALSDSAPFQDFPCCGSFITTKLTRETAHFQRYLPATTITITQENVANEIKMDVGYIRDLTMDPVENDQVRLTWTAPDMGGHRVSRYEIKYAFNIQDIVDNFDTIAVPWKHDIAHPFSIGDQTSLIISIAKEKDLLGQPVFFAIRPYSKLTIDALPGPLSNPVRVFIKVMPTMSPKSPNGETPSDKEVDGGFTLGEYDESGVATSGGSEEDIKMKYIIPIITGFLCVLCIIAMYCIICMFRRHKKRMQKQNHNRQMNQESLFPKHSPEIDPNNTSHDNQSRYHSPLSDTRDKQLLEVERIDSTNEVKHASPPNSSPIPRFTMIDQPDHHTIGIPVYTNESGESLTQATKLYDSAIPDDYNQPHNYIDHIEIVAPPPSVYGSCTGVSVISSNNLTLPRKGRILSPYESWTASQLLHEHEQRISPLGELLNCGSQSNSRGQQQPGVNADQISVSGMNHHSNRTSLSSGSAAPPVPPLPYTTEGYHPRFFGVQVIPTLPSRSGQSTYSTISRGHAHKGNLNFSNQSPGNPAAASGDKRRRNVTMV